MKTLAVVVAGIVLCVLGGCNRAEPPKIAVFDLVRTINESNQGKKANAELDTLLKTKQAELKERAEALDALKKSVEKEPPATKKAKEDELAKASAEYQQLAASSDAELKKKTSELRGKVLEELRKVLDAIGSEDKLLLIMASENVAYHQKSIDITERVITKYNEQ